MRGGIGYIGRIRSSLEKLRIPKRAECGSPKKSEKLRNERGGYCGRAADTGKDYADWPGILGLEDIAERGGDGVVYRAGAEAGDAGGCAGAAGQASAVGER